MLARHSFIYGFANGVPALIKLLAIVVFTRMVSAEDFGEYSICIAAASLVNAVFFNWIRLGLIRFYPSRKETHQSFFSTILVSFSFVWVVIVLLTFCGFLISSDIQTRRLILAGVFLLAGQGLFGISQEFFRINLAPIRYSSQAFSKATISLGLGSLFAYLGYGSLGLLLGLIIGQIVPALFFFKDIWGGARFKKYDSKLLHKLVSYGLPLSGTFALTFVISSTDRFLLGWFLGSEATGLYSVGHNLATHSLGMVMMVVNLAAYPLIVRALEEGREPVRLQLSNYATLLAAVAFPATAGFVLLAPNIAATLLGPEFRETAAWLMPWIAIGALLGGLKAFYFDLSFQLSCFTLGQFWIVLVAAAVNLLSNFFLIPKLGILGAVVSTVIAYALGLSLSIVFGKKVFSLPLPHTELFKIIVSTIFMSIGLMTIMTKEGTLWFVGQIIFGLTILTCCFLIFNVANARVRVLNLRKVL